MTRAEAMAELERIAQEAEYPRDRIAAIRLLKEFWDEEDEDPQGRVVELFREMAANRS